MELTFEVFFGCLFRDALLNTDFDLGLLELTLWISFVRDPEHVSAENTEVIASLFNTDRLGRASSLLLIMLCGVGRHPSTS